MGNKNLIQLFVHLPATMQHCNAAFQNSALWDMVSRRPMWRMLCFRPKSNPDMVKSNACSVEAWKMVAMVSWTWNRVVPGLASSFTHFTDQNLCLSTPVLATTGGKVCEQEFRSTRSPNINPATMMLDNLVKSQAKSDVLFINKWFRKTFNVEPDLHAIVMPTYCGCWRDHGDQWRDLPSGNIPNLLTRRIMCS